jgi:serine/threonine protein kinase
LQAKRIRIDSKNIFTIPLVGICKKTLHNKHHPFWQGNKYSLQLIYPYAGREFTKLKLPNDVDKWKFFCGFYSFVEFISRMNMMGFYHLDIKEANILFINNFFKLIDFDLCLNKDEVYQTYTYEQKFVYTIYMYWPPEVNFIMNEPETIHRMFILPKKLEKLYTNRYFSKNAVLKNLNAFFSSEDYAELRHDPSKIDYTKIDLYSVGLIMRRKLYGFNKDIDALLDRATEFIPSKRYNWPSFLAAYKKILIKNFG